MTTADQVFDALGTAGGVLLACALWPQIYLAHKRRSTKDISFMWQAVYFVGLTSIFLYYLHYKLWAVIYPVVVELFCITYLTCYKIYLEVISPRRALHQGEAVQQGPTEATVGGKREGATLSIVMNGMVAAAVGTGAEAGNLQYGSV